jgi:hypothetical protein
MWTRFMDMHSGGGAKEGWEYIYIEAPEEEACVIFYNRFGHNPHRVTCTCCGADYSVYEHSTLKDATGYDRNCATVKTKEGWKYIEEPNTQWGKTKLTSLEDHVADPSVLVIYAADIKPEEREGYLPQQGYVWQD